MKLLSAFLSCVLFVLVLVGAPRPAVAEPCGLDPVLGRFMLLIYDASEFDGVVSDQALFALGGALQDIDTKDLVQEVKQQSGRKVSNALSDLVAQGYAIINNERYLELSAVTESIQALRAASLEPCLTEPEEINESDTQTSSETPHDDDSTPDSNEVADPNASDTPGLVKTVLTSKVLWAILACTSLAMIVYLFILPRLPKPKTPRKICKIPMQVGVEDTTLYGYARTLCSDSVTFSSDISTTKEALDPSLPNLPISVAVTLPGLEINAQLEAMELDKLKIVFERSLTHSELNAMLDASLTRPVEIQEIPKTDLPDQEETPAIAS